MRREIYIILLAGALGLTACSGSGNSGSSLLPALTTAPAPTTTPASNGVALTILSQTVFNKYLGWTSNDPTNIQMTVSLTKYGTSDKDVVYGGQIDITYQDSGNSYDDTFSSLVDPAGIVSGNFLNNIYNLLSTGYGHMPVSKTLGYHGFFEDVNGRSNTTFPVFGGAVILVIDSTNALGDGSMPTLGSGSVWFMNYTGSAPVSPTSCWFISTGPYDCQTWVDGDSVDTKESIYPKNPYTELATFTNMDLTTVFNF